MAIPRIPLMLSMMVMLLVFAESGDNNRVFSPCADTTVQKSDGFTFGIAFASRDKFSYNNTLLSPCDRRLALSSQNSQIAAFRPKVDEISLLSINTTSSFFPVSSPWFWFVRLVLVYYFYFYLFFIFCWFVYEKGGGTEKRWGLMVLGVTLLWSVRLNWV